MPRQPRQFEVGGVYHVFNRGHDKRTIYVNDNDYLRFIESLYWFNNRELIIMRDLTLAERRFPRGLTPVVSRNIDRRKPIVNILAFTLMPNHFHIIVKEITKGGTSLFMKKLSDSYTLYFNEKYDRKGTGGLFQGRYGSVRIKNDIQLMNIFNYVHTNPVELVEPEWKDLIVKNKIKALNYLKNYKWSSYHDYVGNKLFPYIIKKDFYYSLIGESKECQQSVEDWVKFKAENINTGV